MNKDFRVAVGFFTHPKTNALRHRFQDHEEWAESPLIRGDHAIVCLLRLWGYAAEHFPDGKLWGAPKELEFQVGWLGPDGVFLKAVIDLALLIPDGEDRWILNDWPEHNPWCAGANERSRLASIAGKASGNARREKARQKRESNGPPTEGSHIVERNTNGTVNGTRTPSPNNNSTTKTTRRASKPKQQKLPGQDNGFAVSRNQAIELYTEIRGMTPGWAQDGTRKEFAALKKAIGCMGDDFHGCWQRFLLDRDSFASKHGFPTMFLRYRDQYRETDSDKETRQMDREYRDIKNQKELKAWEVKWNQ